MSVEFSSDSTCFVTDPETHAIWAERERHYHVVATLDALYLGLQEAALRLTNLTAVYRTHDYATAEHAGPARDFGVYLSRLWTLARRIEATPGLGTRYSKRVTNELIRLRRVADKERLNCIIRPVTHSHEFIKVLTGTPASDLFLLLKKGV